MTALLTFGDQNASAVRHGRSSPAPSSGTNRAAFQSKSMKACSSPGSRVPGYSLNDWVAWLQFVFVPLLSTGVCGTASADAHKCCYLSHTNCRHALQSGIVSSHEFWGRRSNNLLAKIDYLEHVHRPVGREYNRLCSLSKLVSLGQEQYLSVVASPQTARASEGARTRFFISGLLSLDAMDRENCSSSTASTPGYLGARKLPPSEVSTIPRVMTRSAPLLPTTETQATPSLWSAATTTKAPGRRTASGVEESFSDSTFSSPCPPSRTGTGSLSEIKLSLADSTPTASPHSDEHRHMVPAYEQSYEPVRPPVVIALPGTMSSRASSDQRHAANGKGYDKRQTKNGAKESKESPPLGHRFSSAVKGFFRKDPVNDLQFEYIGERHWSED